MPQSQWNRPPVEALESRTMLSAGSSAQDPSVAALRGLDRVSRSPEYRLEEWPLTTPGVLRVGKTLYIRGTDDPDDISIGFVSAPAPTTQAPRPPLPRQVRITFNTRRLGSTAPSIFQRVPLQSSFAFKRVFISGLGGDDRIEIGPNVHAFKPKTVVLRGGLGNDTILGGLGAEYILGEDGDDTLDGRAGRDVIDGGDGNDTITGGNSPDVLIGRAGNDVFRNFEGFDARGEGLLSPRDILFPGPGTDVADNDPADLIRDDTA